MWLAFYPNRYYLFSVCRELLELPTKSVSVCVCVCVVCVLCSVVCVTCPVLAIAYHKTATCRQHTRDGTLHTDLTCSALPCLPPIVCLPRALASEPQENHPQEICRETSEVASVLPYMYPENASVQSVVFLLLSVS